MKDTSYVRVDMLPEQAPPISQSGAVKWVRENMFGSITDSILSLLAIYFLYSLLSSVLPWIFQSSWNAESLGECREAIAAAYGEGVTGACWAVIRERWLQLLFGFYPSELYWRPIVAFVLMLVAIAPVLYSALPRKMLWFSAIYPFLAFWLFWGGTIWTPLAVIAGFVLGFACIAVLPRLIGSLGATVAAILVPIIWWVFLTGPIILGLNQVSAGLMRDGYIQSAQSQIETYQATLDSGTLTASEATTVSNSRNEAERNLVSAIALPELEATLVTLEEAATLAEGTDAEVEALDAYTSALSGLRIVYAEVGRIGPKPVESALFGGFMLSIVIGVTGIVLSLPIGVLLALGRQSDLLIVKSICVGFIEFIRGVPLITLLFVASVLLNYFLPPGTTFDIILRVMIMVTLFSAAYMAEVVRGGLAALPRGQYEAADALGLDYWKAQRLIIMPQALKISIPSIVGNFIGLFKDTTLVSIIGLLDPVGLSNSIRADQDWNGIVWELYGFIAFMFFIFCFSMGRYAMYLEKKLRTGH